MYVTRRFWLKNGNEDDVLECTVKEWDTVAEALRYLRRYQCGLRYVCCEIQNENGRVVYEDYAGQGETLYDAKGNIVESDGLINTNPVDPVENGVYDFEMTAKGIEDTEEVLATMTDMRECVSFLNTALSREQGEKIMSGYSGSNRSFQYLMDMAQELNATGLSQRLNTLKDVVEIDVAYRLALRFVTVRLLFLLKGHPKLMFRKNQDRISKHKPKGKEWKEYDAA